VDFLTLLGTAVQSGAKTDYRRRANTLTLLGITRTSLAADNFFFS